MKNIYYYLNMSFDFDFDKFDISITFRVNVWFFSIIIESKVLYFSNNFSNRKFKDSLTKHYNMIITK